MRLSRDGWGGLAVLAASLFLFALTFGLKDNPLVPIGPAFYPRLVLGLSAILAAALVAFDLFGGHRPKPLLPANYGAVVLHFAVFGLYVICLPCVGFRVGTFLYIAVANALLDMPKAAKGWIRVAAISLIATLVLYFVFEHYLTVLLPRGRWTGF